MADNIIPADKGFRKKIILFLIFVTMVLIIMEPHFQRHLDQIEQQSQKDPELAFKQTMGVFKFCMGFVSLLLLCVGIYLILLARRTSKSGQYPPPGMKVIRDTRIRTGAEAKSITVLMFSSSVIFIIFAFLVLYSPWALESKFMKKRNPEIKPNTGVEQKRGDQSSDRPPPERPGLFLTDTSEPGFQQSGPH